MESEIDERLYSLEGRLMDELNLKGNRITYAEFKLVLALTDAILERGLKRDVHYKEDNNKSE